MPSRNELLTQEVAATGAVGATFTGGIFIIGVNQSLTTGTSFDLAITTGTQAIVMDSPIVNSNSGDLSFVIFEDSVFSGGSTVVGYLNDRNSSLVPDIDALLLDPVVTDDGNQASPVINLTGDNASGKSSDFLVGYSFIFKPMTNYILRVTHNDGQTRQVNIYIAAYRRRDV